MSDPLNPWFGIEQASEPPKVATEHVDRRRPVEERTLRAAEVLAGFRGDQLDHAVRFRDLERFQDSILTRAIPAQEAITGELTRQIEAQTAAIDGESRALVKKFNDLFDAAAQDIDSLGEVVDANYEVYQTFLDEDYASIETFVGSIDGIQNTWAIRATVNGHVSGLSFMQEAIDGGAQSDFTIIDASLRVVNTSDVESPYTPFAVYPSGRTVNGAFVPAGVHAQDLYVTRANIADLAVDNARIATAAISSAKIQDLAVTNAKIGNLAVSSAKIDDLAVTNGKIDNLSVTTGKIQDLSVSTLKVAGNAISAPYVASAVAGMTGNNTFITGPSITIFARTGITVAIRLILRFNQGYVVSGPTWGFRLLENGSEVISRDGMTFGVDYPSLSLLTPPFYVIPSGSEFRPFTYRLDWKGSNSDISCIPQIEGQVFQR